MTPSDDFTRSVPAVTPRKKFTLVIFTFLIRTRYDSEKREGAAKRAYLHKRCRDAHDRADQLLLRRVVFLRELDVRVAQPLQLLGGELDAVLPGLHHEVGRCRDLLPVLGLLLLGQPEHVPVLRVG